MSHNCQCVDVVGQQVCERLNDLMELLLQWDNDADAEPPIITLMPGGVSMKLPGEEQQEFSQLSHAVNALSYYIAATKEEMEV